jgi:hypothetical protein
MAGDGNQDGAAITLSGVSKLYARHDGRADTLKKTCWRRWPGASGTTWSPRWTT